MGSLNAVVVSEGPDVKEVLHTKVNIFFSQNPSTNLIDVTGQGNAPTCEKI